MGTQNEAATQPEGPGNTAGPQFRKVILPPKLSRRGRKPILPRVFTVPEVAAILRCGKAWVYTLLQRGYLQGFKLGVDQRGPGPWRVTDLAVLAFMGFPSPGYPAQPRGEKRATSEKAKAARRINRSKGGRRGKSLGQRTITLSPSEDLTHPGDPIRS